MPHSYHLDADSAIDQRAPEVSEEAAAAINKFESLGYSIVQGNSDWVIGMADRKIQVELLNGWADAAREMQSLSGSKIDGWRTRRLRAVDQGASTMRVGHIEFFATPSTTR